MFDLFWNIWMGFVGFLEQILLWFGVMTGNLGIGLILFTICARLLILPLTLTSIKSGRKMQELQPLIKEIQRKYGKDPKKFQEETIKLYQQHRVNPVGGCLPMVFQLPIFLGVYQAVYHLMVPNEEGQHEWLSFAAREAVDNDNIRPLLDQSFLSGWLWNLTGIESADSISRLLAEPFLWLNLGTAAFDANTGAFTGIAYTILPTLAVVLQLLQQLMAMPRVMDQQQKIMFQTMLFMPLVFAYIAFTFPIGAVIYWVTSGLIGVTQQYFISGWGSLANYLKFLPPDRGLPQPALTAPISVEDGDSAAPAAEQRVSFWDVLRPLTEVEVTSSAASGVDTTTSVPASGDSARRMTDRPNASRRSRRRRS